MHNTDNQTDRAQTTLDFAIAMGVFLLAIAFVFTFIPSLVAPFIGGSQDQSATADRVASHLSEGALGDPNKPFVVDQECATVFFNESTDDDDIPERCGYSGGTLHERVGMTDRLHVRVEILQVDAGVSDDARFRQVCDDNGTITHEGVNDCQGPGVVTYQSGESSTPDDSVTVARRIVTIPDCEFGSDVKSCDTTIRVAVW